MDYGVDSVKFRLYTLFYFQVKLFRNEEEGRNLLPEGILRFKNNWFYSVTDVVYDKDSQCLLFIYNVTKNLVACKYIRYETWSLGTEQFIN